MDTQRHWLNHWWFRAIVLAALVLALMLAVRLHSASGERSQAALHQAPPVVTTNAAMLSLPR